jgi:hypothetical protein
MTTQNFEDWLIGASAAIAVTATLGVQLIATTPLASTANAAEAAPAYTLTITAQRLPAACKTQATKNSAYCAQFGVTHEEMTAR